MVKRFRPIRTPIHFTRMFQREGIAERKKVNPNISELHDASIFLFKHILHPEDVRWRLATKYAELKKEVHLSPINLENGLRANYASRTIGRNKAYGAGITGQLHVVQLARAIRNIELGQEHFAWRKPIPFKNPKYQIRFAKTDQIEKKTNRHGVSGCPEAMWQLQLWRKEGYLGRVGINFHSEGKDNIITVANIQGADGKKEQQLGFKHEFGKNFGDALVEKVEEIFGPGFKYRGILQAGKNEVQYRMAFRKAKPDKIKIWSTQSKMQIEDRRTIKN